MNVLGQNTTGDLINGGVVNGNLNTTGSLTSQTSIGLLGKYILPIDEPTGANNVIQSDGTTQLVWTSDISVGDVNSITNSTVNNEIVLYNGASGKSIKNSGITSVNGVLDVIGLKFVGVQFEDGGNGQYSTLNSAGEYTGYFGDTCQCYRSDNSASGALVTLSKTRGTQFIPLSMIINDYLSEINSQGHVGGNVYRFGSYIKTRCTENWSPGNAGSNMILATTNQGNTEPNPKLILDDDGVTVTNNNFNVQGNINVQGNLKSIVIQDTTSGTGLCNGALSFHDINNAGVHTLSCPFGPLIFYHLGTPELSIGPTQVIAYGNVEIQQDLVVDGNINTPNVFSDKIYIGQDTNSWRVEKLGSNLALDFFDELNERQFILGKGDIKPYRNANDALPCFFQFRKRRGNTETITDSVLSGDGLLKIVGSGFKGPLGGFGENAGIEMNATENYTPTTSGSNIVFSTTANTTTTRLERMRIEDNGNVEIKQNLLVDGGNLSINSSGSPTLEFKQSGGAKWSQKVSFGDLIFTDIEKGIEVLTLSNFSPGQEHLRSKATQNYVEGSLELNAGVNTFKFPTTRPTDGQFLYATDANGNLGWTSSVDNSPAYCQMYFINNLNPTTMTSQAAWFPMASTGNISGGDWITGPTSNFTYSTQGCDYTGTDPRTFKISLSVAWANDDNKAEVFQLGVVINGVPGNIGRMRSVLDDSAAHYPHNTSIDFIIELTNGANILPAVTCLSANNQCLVYDASFNITQINSGSLQVNSAPTLANIEEFLQISAKDIMST